MPLSHTTYTDTITYPKPLLTMPKIPATSTTPFTLRSDDLKGKLKPSPPVKKTRQSATKRDATASSAAPPTYDKPDMAVTINRLAQAKATRARTTTDPASATVTDKPTLPTDAIVPATDMLADDPPISSRTLDPLAATLGTKGNALLSSPPPPHLYDIEMNLDPANQYPENNPSGCRTPPDVRDSIAPDAIIYRQATMQMQNRLFNTACVHYDTHQDDLPGYNHASHKSAYPICETNQFDKDHYSGHFVTPLEQNVTSPKLVHTINQLIYWIGTVHVQLNDLMTLSTDNTPNNLRCRALVHIIRTIDSQLNHLSVITNEIHEPCLAYIPEKHDANGDKSLNPTLSNEFQNMFDLVENNRKHAIELAENGSPIIYPHIADKPKAMLHHEQLVLHLLHGIIPATAFESRPVDMDLTQDCVTTALYTYIKSLITHATSTLNNEIKQGKTETVNSILE